MLSDKVSRMKAGSCIFKILLPVTLLAVPLAASAQKTSSCAENLKAAQSLFEKGIVERVPDTLCNCMKSGFKREEQMSAYKLLIQSYILGDKMREADSTMLSFLKGNPEYQLSPTDHASFVYLYNNFKVKPVIQFVLHIGTNLPFVTFVTPKTASGENSRGTYSSSFLNLFGSLEAKYSLNSSLDLNLEAGYSQLSFTNTEDFLGFGVVNYSEVQQRIEIPLTASYNFITFGKFTTYARAGAGIAFNISAMANKISFDEAEVINFTPRTRPPLDRTDSRIKTDFFGQAGVGLKYKIPRGFFNFEVRTNLGVYDQVIRGGQSAEDAKGYFYIDDDFNLNDINISLGYTLIIYKPSKRK